MSDSVPRIVNKALICLLGFLLAGCLHVSIPQDRLAAMKRVGVVSFLGDVIELRDEQLFPPGIVPAPFGVPSWGIDRYTRELVAGEIVRHGVEVVPFEYDYEALWKKNYDGPDIRTFRLRDSVKDALSDIAQRNDLDTLIIVYGLPSHEPTAPYQILPICLIRYHGFAGRSVSYYVRATIRVLDGKSMETVGSGGFFYKEALDVSFWPPFSDTSQLLLLESKTKRIMKEKIATEVKELGFDETAK